MKIAYLVNQKNNHQKIETMSTATIVILVIIGLFIAAIALNGQNNVYKEKQREDLKVGIGSVILWIILGIALAFGFFGNLIGGY